MALSKDKKQQLLSEIANNLSGSKLTVIASYRGTSVKAMQQLRANAKESSTTVKVYKNRLVKIALKGNQKLSGLDSSSLSGQLLYAFNNEDEVAPAQVLANFAKTNPQIEFVGAINQDGELLSADDVKQLASLPSKDALRAQLVGLLNAPLSGFVGVMSGNLRGLVSVLSARAESIN